MDSSCKIGLNSYLNWFERYLKRGIFLDFEKGFIRAEVIAYEDYITYGSEAKCREVGKLRVEGKEYIVNDGDIMHFRFNV